MVLLNSKEKAALRGQAQRLRPAVNVGKNGLQESVVVELERAFGQSALVKVGFKATREALPGLVELVEAKLDCQCVGGVGRTRSFYRARKSD